MNTQTFDQESKIFGVTKINYILMNGVQIMGGILNEIFDGINMIMQIFLWFGPFRLQWKGLDGEF